MRQRRTVDDTVVALGHVERRVGGFGVHDRDFIQQGRGDRGAFAVLLDAHDTGRRAEAFERDTKLPLAAADVQNGEGRERDALQQVGGGLVRAR